MAADLTALNPVLKDTYKDLIDQLNNKCWLLPQIDKNGEAFDGRRAIHAIHVRRNSGIGSRAEGGTLPTATNQSYATVPVPMRYHFARIALSGQILRHAANDTGAFVNALDSEMTGAMNDAMRDRCRQVWGTSNGVIAQCGVTTAANVIVLDAATTLVQMRQLWFDGGMAVDIGTVANPTLRTTTTRNVTAYSDTTPGSYTITVDGGVVTTAITDFVFRSGNGGASSGSGLPGDGQVELTGMQTIVDNSATLHTITVASQPVWKSYQQAVGGLPTEAVINNAIQKAQIASGKGIDAIVCSEGVHQSVANQLLSTKRHMNTVDLKGGYKGIEWNAPMVNAGDQTICALVIDSDCPGGTLFGLSFKSFVWYQLGSGDWEWDDTDGAVLRRATNSTYAFDGALVSFAELAAKQRNSMFKLTGITETTA